MSTIVALAFIAASCGQSGDAVQAAPSASSPTFTLSDSSVNATIDMPNDASAGDTTSAKYTITNRTSEPLKLMGGDCGGYLAVTASSTSDRSLQRTFSVIEEGGYCNTIRNSRTIEPLGMLEGQAFWKAGMLGGEPQPIVGDVLITFELTRLEGDREVALTQSMSFSVRG